MPLRDDATIPNSAVLLRVLIDDANWRTQENGRYRPSSLAFFSTNQDVSYFLDVPGVVDELNRIFAGFEIASIPASVIREAGFVIERRPGECPEDFRCDRTCHVVAGPIESLERKVHQKRARQIAKHPAVTIINPQKMV